MIKLSVYSFNKDPRLKKKVDSMYVFNKVILLVLINNINVDLVSCEYNITTLDKGKYSIVKLTILECFH